jgi:hypothetical protein
MTTELHPLSDERYVENRRALALGRDLLAELKQAEREKADAYATWGQSLADVQVRLAKADKLAEAASDLLARLEVPGQREFPRLRAALAAWESE